MIQAIMLIALGFLTASLIGVLLAPSLWSRAARLSKKRLESTLPLNLAEIEAAQDQLRAAYAVRVRRLESSLASAKQKAANHLVDNSRLQMQIVALKDQIASLDQQLAERRNAATVLEQTITKRFPELDREITVVKAQLQERSYELHELTGKLARREEELAATQEAASSYQEELNRLHQVLEKSAADRSGRRIRRASQWDLDDYRAEYDRLNLELSKLRQQLALLQDRDSQQTGLIKGELQKLADLILASAEPRNVEERIEPPARRLAVQDVRRERPASSWRKPVPPPAPLAARVTLDGVAPPRLAPPETKDDAKPASSSAPEAEKTVPAPSQKNGHGEAGGRPKILQEVVRATSAPQAAEEAKAPSLAGGGTPAPAQPELPRSEDLKPDAGAEPVESAAMNGARRPSRQSGEAAEATLEDAINLDALESEPEHDKIGPPHPRLLDRLRGIGEPAADQEKTPPLRGA